LSTTRRATSSRTSTWSTVRAPCGSSCRTARRTKATVVGTDHLDGRRRAAHRRAGINAHATLTRRLERTCRRVTASLRSVTLSGSTARSRAASSVRSIVRSTRPTARRSRARSRPTRPQPRQLRRPAVQSRRERRRNHVADPERLGRGNDGVGFAIPASTVKNIADQLIANGSVKHALSASASALQSTGVGVRAVESRSGADKAGVKSWRRDHRRRRHHRSRRRRGCGRLSTRTSRETRDADSPALRLDEDLDGDARHRTG